MHIKKINIVLLILALSSCGVRQAEDEKKSDSIQKENAKTKLDEIVLVNIDQSNRCEIGNLISFLSSCNPKAIGVNLLFSSEREYKCDSALRQSIIDSDKVILVEGYKSGKHIKSIDKFSDVSYLTGLTGLIESDTGIIDYYYRQTDVKGRWAYSFPFLLALQYDKNRGSELAAKSTPEDYPIVLYHDLNSFRMIEAETSDVANCNLLNKKIVIIGYLGPEDKDSFFAKGTENLSNKAYGTVIIANVVLDILQDLNK